MQIKLRCVDIQCDLIQQIIFKRLSREVLWQTSVRAELQNKKTVEMNELLCAKQRFYGG